MGKGEIFDSKNSLTETSEQVIDVRYSDTTTEQARGCLHTEPIVSWEEDLQGHCYSYASESANIETFAAKECKIINQKESENGK